MSFNRAEIRLLLLLLLLLSSSLLLRFEAQQQFAASTSITASHVDPEYHVAKCPKPDFFGNYF